MIAEAVCRHHAVENEDVASVHFRGTFSVLQASPRMAIENSFPHPRFRRRSAFCRARSELDERITRLVGWRDFVLYVPHLAHPAYESMSLHPLCRHVSYVEEGTDSMLSKPWYRRGVIPGTPIKRPFISVASFGLQGLRAHLLLNRSYRRVHDSEFYHISREAFPWARHRICLTEEVKTTIDGTSRKVEPVLVVSALKQSRTPSTSHMIRGSIPFDSYTGALRRVSDLLRNRGYTRTHVKFHMEDSNNRCERQQVLDALRGGGNMEVRVIDDGSLLERELAGRIAIGTNSSALHYATLLGGLSFSIETLLDEEGKKWLRDFNDGTVLAALPDIQQVPRADAANALGLTRPCSET